MYPEMIDFDHQNKSLPEGIITVARSFYIRVFSFEYLRDVVPKFEKTWVYIINIIINI